MIIEGTEAAAIHNFPGFVDHVKALRPAAVEVVGEIVHCIDAER